MASKTFEIRENYVTRVEGHANIFAEVKDGKLTGCRLELPESPRLFESFARGREWWEMHWIIARICGICNHSHQLTSLRATENALGIKISDQTFKLRVLIDDAEQLESHMLHVAYLVAPDLFKVKSALALAQVAPEVVKAALRLKRLANDMFLYLTGFEVHCMRMVPGGFTLYPTMEELKLMRQAFDDREKDVMLIVDTVFSVADKLPAFTRETEYISLKHEKDFPFYDGLTYSSDTKKTYDNLEYQSVVNEFVIPYSTCKRAKHERSSFFVGALARVNNNAGLLSGLAAALAKKFNFKAPCINPFMNSVAQIVEYGLAWERAKKYLDQFIADGIENEQQVKPNFKNAGRGVGITEAPRGLLIHDYTYDKSGKCLKANCVIPTNLNTGNMEDDMKAMVPQLVDAGKSPEDIKFMLEMLIRAYDPCFSCSVHLIEK